VQRPPKCVHARTKSYLVRWRDPKTRASQGLAVAGLAKAETLKRLLDANDQSFQIAQYAILFNEKRTPTALRSFWNTSTC
jgi:hypothetical protein